MITAPRKLTLILLVFLLPASLIHASGSREKPLESSTFFALGTSCSVSLYGGTDEQFNDIEAMVAGIENRMSVNIAGSEINRINNAAGKSGIKVSEDVFKVISAGLHFSELSNGTFDISIGPLVSLWKIGNGGESVPPDREIRSALELVDYRQVRLGDNGTIFLSREGMALEPGGIAKGYTADAIAGYLRGNNIESGLINLGGNVLAMGRKADGSSWRIGIQNPDSSRGDYIGIVKIEDKSVVTSGKYERFFIGADGRRYHHILSTSDGYPVENGIAQVSIITAESMTADAMSTTVFSMGPERGLETAENMEGVEAILVMEDNSIVLTSGMKDIFNLTDNSFKLSK